MQKPGLVLFFIIVFVFGGTVFPALAVDENIDTEPVIAAADPLVALYNTVSPSVVSLNVTRSSTLAPSMPGMPPPTPMPMSVIGSGFVIDNEGHILTNNHVVDESVRIDVNFHDGTLARAQVIGLDPDSDLAVIKVNLPPAQLHPVTFGDSDALAVGEPVVAIGSPFGQHWTLTSGIVSATDRMIFGLTNFTLGGVIQTDAAINPGNSGGPLLDFEGRVVGVNSQIISTSFSNAGVGFAIPGNLAERVGRALVEDGYISHSYLGIKGHDVDLLLIERLNLPNNTRGVVISEVLAGGPAARAGLLGISRFDMVDGWRVPSMADIIVAADEISINNVGSLTAFLARYKAPGDEVLLMVLRNGTETLTIKTRLTPRPTRLNVNPYEMIYGGLTLVSF